MKKPVLFFTCADKNNFTYAVGMLNSLTKFHKDVDILLITDEDDKTKLALLPKQVRVEALSIYTKDDPNFFYRQKPVVMEAYIDQYDLIVGLDADQIILGSLDYILKTQGYDVGTVINWNRVDPQVYGYVQFQGIMPVEYFNCGLVAVRSKKFVHHWKVLCFSPQFGRLQYKEQDLLNVLCYYGNYNVRCFDIPDGVAKYSAWHGLISKGELLTAELKGSDIIIPKGQGDTPFPPEAMLLKVIHAGGGNQPNKMNFRTWFSNEKIIERIAYLIS